MRVSGAEAVVAAASPFIGQGESAMLIKPFVGHLTQAELHQVMLVFPSLILRIHFQSPKVLCSSETDPGESMLITAQSLQVLRFRYHFWLRSYRIHLLGCQCSSARQLL